jgi:DNA-binding Lrp family transcriptional regulator
LDALDKRIVAVMQESFPLVFEPYAVLAQQIGISEAELFDRLDVLHKTGGIRKFGAVLTHRKIGYAANALCAWQVSEDQVEAAGTIMAACKLVTHCYCREKKSDWPYNLYTMIHGKTRLICVQIAQQLAVETKLTDYVLLFSTKEWKKTSMRYFQEQ